MESTDEDASTIPTIKRKGLIELLKVSEEPAFYPEQMFGSDAVIMAKLNKNRPQKVIHFLTYLSESSFLRRMGNVFPPFPALFSSLLTTLVATLVLSDCCALPVPQYIILYCVLGPLSCLFSKGKLLWR